MVDKAISADAETEIEEADDAEPGAVKREEPIKRARKSDPFADAFEAAEKELDPDEADKVKQASPKKAKADAATDSQADKGKPAAKQAGKKPDAQAKTTKAAGKENDDESDDDEPDAAAAPKDDGDREDEDDRKLAAPKKAQASDKTEASEAAKSDDDKAKQPLAAKRYWPRERREAFAYQPRDVQEAWLKEAPVPYGHWSDEQKAGFGKLPLEAKELLLEQAQEIERGYGQKFQALAGERKMNDAIKAAVSPEMRTFMEQQGVDEPAAFKRLLDAQYFSMKDPVGYIRRFIATARIDPRQIFPSAGGENATDQTQGAQPVPMPQADILSHPVVSAMVTQVHALTQAMQSDREQRARDDDRRLNDEIGRTLGTADEGGNSRYPLIRILAGPMAELIEAEPERFGAMSVDQKISEAYRLALESFPELTPPKTTPKPAPTPPAEEAADEDAEDDSEAERQAEKLKKAATKKSKTPQSAPSNGGDPFARAFARAERQIGHR